MIGNEALIAKKYARAWMECVDPVSLQVIDLLGSWNALWRQRTMIHYLRLDVIPNSIKVQIIEQSLQTYALEPQMMRPLIQLLESHGRLWLLGYSIYEYVSLWYKQHGIEEFEMSTVDPLTDRDIERIKRAVLRYTVARDVRIKTRLDASLIAGMRLEGTYFLWEYSVRRQLAALGQIC